MPKKLADILLLIAIIFCGAMCILITILLIMCTKLKEKFKRNKLDKLEMNGSKKINDDD